MEAEPSMQTIVPLLKRIEHKVNNVNLSSQDVPGKLDYLRPACRQQRDVSCRAPACDASGAAMTDRVDFGDAGCIGCPKSPDRLDAIPASTDADPAGHAPIARRA